MSVSSTPELEKAPLRKLARNTLRKITPEDRQHRGALLLQNLTEHLKSNHPSAHRIATFAALPHEPDLSLLHALLPEREFYYPLVQEDYQLSFHLVSDPETLERGMLNLLEPNLRIHPPIIPEELDLILVPGLAFDLQGFRLGQGGGYYDRFLASLPHIPRLGISFHSQMLPSVPSEAHDEAVAIVVTDREVIHCNSRSLS